MASADHNRSPEAGDALSPAASADSDPRASTTLLVTLIGTILLFAVVLTAILLFLNAEWVRAEQEARAPKDPELARVQMEQLAPVSQYRMVDPAKGLVAVPIDEAIRLFVADQKAPASQPNIDSVAPSANAAPQASPGMTE